MSADRVGLGFFIGQTCALDSTFYTHPGMFLCWTKILCISYFLVLIVSFFCLHVHVHVLDWSKILLKIWSRFEITSDELEYTQDTYNLLNFSNWNNVTRSDFSLKITKVQSSNIPFLWILRILSRYRKQILSSKISILSSNSIFHKWCDLLSSKKEPEITMQDFISYDPARTTDTISETQFLAAHQTRLAQGISVGQLILERLK